MLTSTTHTTEDTKKGIAGFTLIELSIVLVIIGLIVGGILTGQDLIRSAEQRATIAQIEKYNTAVNTFRGKFGGVPGDLLPATATSFGLFSNTTGGAGYGDGNGLVEGGSAAATPLLGETIIFWRHLSDAGLVDGSFGSALTAGGAAGANITTSAGANAYIPPAKLGRSNSITVAEVGGVNYYVIGGFTTITAATGAYDATGKNTNNLTANEGYNIDKKVDDGAPGTGSVQSLSVTGGFAPATTLAGGSCDNGTPAVGGGAGTYTVSTNVGVMACSLRLRFN